MTRPVTPTPPPRIMASAPFKVISRRPQDAHRDEGQRAHALGDAAGQQPPEKRRKRVGGPALRVPAQPPARELLEVLGQEPHSDDEQAEPAHNAREQFHHSFPNMAAWPRRGEASAPGVAMTFASPPLLAAQAASEKETIIGETPPLRSYRGTVRSLEPMRSPTTGEGCQGGDASAAGDPRNAVATMGTGGEALGFVANERESTPRVVGIQRTAHPRSAIWGNRQCTGRVTVNESDASREGLNRARMVAPAGG